LVGSWQTHACPEHEEPAGHPFAQLTPVVLLDVPAPPAAVLPPEPAVKGAVQPTACASAATTVALIKRPALIGTSRMLRHGTRRED
jgi:hypothetical protein